jgi:hypothetical protein
MESTVIYGINIFSNKFLYYAYEIQILALGLCSYKQLWEKNVGVQEITTDICFPELFISSFTKSREEARERA